MSKSNSKERSNLIDAHVGVRVRARRKSLGLSRTDLANAIGLTFQQVQKYERGTNRISASKLFEIAQALQVQVSHFYEGYDEAANEPFEPSQSEQNVQGFLSTSEGIEIAQAFPRIANARHRRRVMELVRTLADEQV